MLQTGPSADDPSDKKFCPQLFCSGTIPSVWLTVWTNSPPRHSSCPLYRLLWDKYCSQEIVTIFSRSDDMASKTWFPSGDWDIVPLLYCLFVSIHSCWIGLAENVSLSNILPPSPDSWYETISADSTNGLALSVTIRNSSANSVNQTSDVTHSIPWWRNGKPCQHHNKFKWQRN